MNEANTLSTKCSCDCQTIQPQQPQGCDYYKQHGCMPPPHFCPWFPPCPPPPWPPCPPPPPSPPPTSDCDWCDRCSAKDLPAISGNCYELDLNAFTVSEVQNPKPSKYRLDKILFRELSGATFKMGSEEAEDGRYSQVNALLDFEPQREVEVAKFNIGVFPVTQKQFEKVTGKVHGNKGCACISEDKKDFGDPRFALPCRAKDFVSFNDVSSFIKIVNKKLVANEQPYEVALPKDEEWEYAARAGSKDPWSASDVSAVVKSREAEMLPPDKQSEATLKLFTRQATNLSCYASYLNGDIAYEVKKDPNRFPPVGSFKPNAWNLYDTLGCVWEWIDQDWRIVLKDKDGNVKDPEYLDEEGKKASLKTVRGGGYWFNADDCRCANRHGYAPGHRNYGFGFRLVLRKKA